MSEPREPILIFDQETGTYRYLGHLHGQLQCLGCWEWFSHTDLTEQGYCEDCEEDLEVDDGEDEESYYQSFCSGEF